MPLNNTTYQQDDGGGRGSKTEYVLNKSTGAWEKQVTSVDSPVSPEDIPSSSTGNDSSTQVDSKKEAEKEYIEVEFNTLVGDLSVKPSNKTIRLKVTDTIELQGFGNNLSGNYFVSAVKRTLSKDSGYSQTMTVMKNGFGDSLKKPVNEESDTRSESVEKSAPQLKVGDSVIIVGDANYTTGEKVPAWVKESTLTVQQISTDNTSVLLMPINSWTYVRFVQKA